MVLKHIPLEYILNISEFNTDASDVDNLFDSGIGDDIPF